MPYELKKCKHKWSCLTMDHSWCVKCGTMRVNHSCSLFVDNFSYKIPESRRYYNNHPTADLKKKSKTDKKRG